MPRNRQDRPHEEKSAEILEIATAFFLERGYAGTTMAAIAKEAGIATNVVHWYFATKDALFVAVLEAIQARDLEDARGRSEQVGPELGPDEMMRELEPVLIEFVWRRLERSELIATLHERSHRTPIVAEFHARAHRRYESALGAVLTQLGVPPDEQRLVVDALVTAIESLVMHRASRAEAEEMMRFLAKRLVAPALPHPSKGTNP